MFLHFLRKLIIQGYGTEFPPISGNIDMVINITKIFELPNKKDRKIFAG
jgi:hypothetical protein